MMLESGRPSLVDLCVRTAISNIRYLGDVGETDLYLLEDILAHCSMDELTHVEKRSVGRDLSPVTDKLWKKFYEKNFGIKSCNLVIEKMKQRKVTFKWKDLYQAKLRDMDKAEKEAVERLKQSYKKEDARKQSRQVQICSKIPSSGSKRSYWRGGPGYDVSNVKSNIMKKSKLDFLKSREVQNLAALKKNAVQKSCSVAPSRTSGFAGNNCVSSSKSIRPFARRK